MTDDAPGWEANDGPTCWKCRGVGTAKAKKIKLSKKEKKEKKTKPSSGKEAEQPRVCPVCEGRGHLLKRKVPEKLGRITRGRKRPQGWSPDGPDPAAISCDDEWSRMVLKANEECVDADIENDNNHDGPEWLPNMGEELCNLVGIWRILQRVGSHRWTTDDIVTAWVASEQQSLMGNDIKYLDLGTGNASVLQMTTWALLKQGCQVDATGVEARSEAVALARRSLQFNLGGAGQETARIVHGDFRDAALQDTYNLVTGTPPYFRVDFDVRDDVVSHAIINQGGMPTAKQSAPARCEFRGGIEAYCAAASKVLNKESGRFVVCENWLNHDRVLAAAKECKLQIVKQVEVMGREGKDNLFCVYVMKVNSDGTEVKSLVQKLAVRTVKGDWTDTYKKRVLASMAIPFC